MFCNIKYLEMDIDFQFSFKKNKKVIVIEREGLLILYLLKQGEHSYSFYGFLYNLKLPIFSNMLYRSKKELLKAVQLCLDANSSYTIKLAREMINYLAKN